jgi:membrane protein YdbS with pleckstrin-like domain
MAKDRSAQTYACKVTGLGGDERSRHVLGELQPGDALTLAPAPDNATAVYRYNDRIGVVEAAWLRDILKPGDEYEARAGRLEFDEAGMPVVLNIEVTVLGRSQGSVSASSRAEPEAWTRDAEPPLYRGSPTMFRAHPIGFIIALLLTPLLIGAIILIVWAIRSRTTHLEIDEQSVRYETGVFSKDRRALSRKSIRTVRVTQTLLNRLLNVGAVEIYTAGDVPEIRANAMYAPNDIRDLLDS